MMAILYIASKVKGAYLELIKPLAEKYSLFLEYQCPNHWDLAHSDLPI